MAKGLIAQVSYLKGLAEGLALDKESSEGKLFSKIIDLLDEMAREVAQLKTDHEELLEYTEAIDEDLSEVEDDFYEDYDGDNGDYEDEDDDDYESFTVECPKCGEMVEISEDLLHTDSPVKVTCPRCGEIVMIDDEDWEEEGLDELLDDEGDGEEEKE